MSSTSQSEILLPDKAWMVSGPKLYGWITGLLFAVFGGMLCVAPVGAVIGVPVVACGILMSLTFSVGMSGTSFPHRISFVLILIGAALVIIGRIQAPIGPIAISFRTGVTMDKRPEILQVFGLPIMMIGIHIIQLVTPWVRVPQRIGFPLSILGLILIEGATIALVIGAVRTGRTIDFPLPPYYLWPVVAIATGLGVAIRTRFRDWAALLVAILIGAIMPTIWLLHRAGWGPG
jgi:hypothetical protein